MKHDPLDPHQEIEQHGKHKKPEFSVQLGLPDSIQFYHCGVSIARGTSEVLLNELFQKLQIINSFHDWSLADIVLFAERTNFADTKAKISSGTKSSGTRLSTLCRVARLFPAEERVSKLSFSHHEAVADCEPSAKGDDQVLWRTRSREWLELALIHDWSAEELRTRISGPRNRTRNLLHWEFVPETKQGCQLAGSLTAWISKREFSPHELDFGLRVKKDLEGILEIVKARIDAHQKSRVDAKDNAAVVTALDKALAAALKEALAGKNFSQSARDRGLTVHELGRFRLERAVEMRSQKMKFAQIYRTLGVKPDKLRAFMRKAMKPIPPLSTGPAEATLPKHTAAAINPVISSESLERALESIKTGISLLEAAKRHDVPIPSLIEFRYAAAAKRYSEVASVHRVAVEFHIDYKSLRNRFQSQGVIPIKHQHFQSETRNELICEK